MQNTVELSRIEQEFEDLQSLIRQHLSSLQWLEDIPPRLHALQEFQEATQTTGQNTAETLDQVKTTQQRLNERTDNFEAHIQQLGDQLANLQKSLNQDAGKADSWAKQKASIMAQCQELENSISLLRQDIERLDKANEAVEKRFLDLEVRLNMHYRLIQQLSEKVKTSYRGMFLWGILGFAIMFFVLRR